MDSINKDFIHEYDFKTLQLNELRLKRSNTTFKIFKIKNCSTFKDIEDLIRQKDFCSVIKQSSYLFFIYIELTSCVLNQTGWSSLQLLTEKERPLIIQIFSISDQIHSIIYKDEKEEKLKMLNVDNNVPISFEEMKNKIEVNETCKFKLLLEAMSSNLCGEFNDNLLDSKLNTSDETQGGFITNELSKTSSFCIRFLQLYRSNMNWSTKLIKTYLQSGVDKFLAYCDLPFNINDEQGISADKRNAISNSFASIMKYSVEIDNSEAVKYLATNFKFDLESMCSIAVDKKRFNSYRELIVAGSKYPPSVINNNNFNPGDCEKLQAIIDQREEFHDNIASGSIDKVKSFLKKTPNLKTVFNTSNKSALTTALKSSQFDVFTFLQSKGFSKEGDAFYSIVWDKLSVKNKEIIARSLREYFGSFKETYLVDLLSKSQLSLSSIEGENDYFKIIRFIYDKLNSHPEIQPILRSIAFSENLKIVFDFNESSVKVMVPVKSDNVRGSTFHEDGYIYMAVKDYEKNFYGLIGTLVHEMTHYAMHLMYKNNCKPYHVKDIEATRFAKVLNKTKEFVNSNKMSSDPIINRVFEGYPPDKWEAELIVRVPQLIARYKTEDLGDISRLDQIKSDFSELFRFYSDKVLKDSGDYQQKAKEQKMIREINQMCPLLKLIEYEKLHFKKTLKLELSQQVESNVILTNVPIMTLVTIFKTFEENEENCLYLNIESLVINENLKIKAKKIFESDIKFMVVIDCTSRSKLMVYKNVLTDFLKLLIVYKNKVILVVKPEDEDSFPTEFSKTINRHTFIHTWEEVEENYRETLLGKEVFFQSSLVKLSQLCEINSKAIHDLPLLDLLKSKAIEVNKQQLLDCPNFINRKFKVLKEYSDNATDADNNLNPTQLSRSNNQELSQTKQNQNPKSRETANAKMDPDKFVYGEKSLEEMIAYGNEKKIVIISDKAGTGKSCVMIEMSRVLKQKSPTTWVSFIDLKEHVTSFASMSCVDIEFHQFMDLTVFKEQNTFDRKLFQDFYLQGRTILLLDGFDEISPNYKEIWVKALKTFNSQAGNRLWITTRSHLGESLETCLSQSSCELLPLSEPEQIDYLKNHWASGPNGSEARDVAKSLIKEFRILTKSGENSVGAPLILSMLAKIYKDQNFTSDASELKSLNLFSIYTQFIKGLVEEGGKKGELAREEREEMLNCRTSHWDVHEKLALKHLCDYERLGLEVEFDENEWNAEKMSRLGIFSEKNGRRIFIHETFAEFFVAHYIFDNLKKMHGSKASSLSSSIEKCIKLLTEVVQSEDKQVVRIFLDQAIGQHKKEIFNSQNQVKDFSQIVEKQVRETESYGILVNIASDSCENLMRMFSNGVEYFENDLRKMILTFEREHRREKMNVLQISSRSRNQQFMEMLFKILESCESKDLKSTIKQSTSAWQSNIFHLTAMNKENEGVFTKVLNYASQRKILNDDEVKTLFQQKDFYQGNIFHFVTEYNNEKSLKEIFTTLKNLLTNEELKSLLIDKNVNGVNCLHLATQFNNQAVVEELCNILESFLEADEVKELFKTCGFRGRNIFHFAAINKKNEGVFTKLLNYASQRKILNDEEVKTLLQQKDSDQWNSFQLVANLNNEKSLKEIFTTLKNLLKDEELKTLLIDKNVNGDNCLHLATQFNNQAVVEEFCNILKSFLEADEVKEFFKTCGFRGRNIFHFAAINKKNEGVFTKLLNYASQRKILNDEEVKTLLQQKDSDQYNIFQLVANVNNEKSLKEIFTTLKDLLTDEELKSLLIDKNVNGVNCLHLATQFNNQAVVEELCNILQSFLEADEVKELFKTCGFKGRNIFHFAAINKKNEGVFTKLLNCVSKNKILNDDEVKTLLQQKDSNQYNIFHFVTEFNNEKSLKEIFTTLKNLLTNEELKSLLIDKNVNGVNCLHLATRFNNQAVVEELCNIFESFLEADEFKNVFKICGFKGRNIFHFAAINKKNEGVFTNVLNHASQRKILNDEKVKTLLQQKDSNQYNIFHFVTEFNNEKSLKEIFTTLKNLLTNEELKSLLIDKNVNGVNCLHLATRFNNQAVVEELCSIFESFLEADEFKNVFKICGFKGRNIFHFAAINKNNEGVFTNVLNHASQRKILDDDEVKTLFQQKDSNQYNIFHFVTEFNNEKSLKEIFTTLKNLLTNEELKSLLIDKNVNGVNCLHLATRFNNQAVVEELCSIFESFLEADEFKNVFKICGSKGRNIFHFAAINKNNEGVFTNVLNHASQRKILDDDEVKTLFQQKDSNQYNIFHFITEFNNEKSLKEIFTTLKNLLTNEELKSLLIDKNVNGHNCLHLATQFNNQAVVEELCNILESFLEADEFKDLFKTCGFKGRNIFHFAAINRKNEGVFTKLLNCVSKNKILNDDEVKTLLQQKGSNQYNIFHFVTEDNNEKSLKEIFTTLKDLLTNEELKSFLIDRNVNGHNCLHLATQFNNQAVVEELCNILESFLEADDVKELFKICGFKGRNIFHFAAINKKNEGVFTKLLNHASQRKILNDDEVKTLLQQKDLYQGNIFHFVTEFNNEKSLKEIFTTLKNLLTNEELKSLLIDRNVNGHNCLHLASRFNNQAVVEELCNILESFLEADEVKNVFKICGFKGRNIFHFAAINKKNEGVFKKLLNCANKNKILNDDEVKTLLQQKGYNQYNIFHFVTEFNNEKSLKEIITTLKDLLTNEELKSLLIDKNVNGVNCLHSATQFNNQAVVEKFCNILESFLEADEVKKLFKTCCFNGRNIFHFAAINKKNEGVFTKLLNYASQRKILNDEEVKTLLQQKDSDQWNIFQFVANLNNEKSLKEIFITLKNLLTNEELKSLLIDKNVNGVNCLHLATQLNNQAFVEELCNILESFLEADEVKKLFKTCCFNGRNIFHFAAINKKNEGVFTKLLNYASQRKILNDEEVKTLLQQKDSDQYNIFQFVANLNNEKSLKEIFITLKNLLTNEELKSLLIDKNVNGVNCLHLATQLNNQAFVEELCNILESFLETDEVKELFKTCGFRGRNIFHFVAINKENEGVLTNVLNYASEKKILNDDEVKTLFQQKDSDQYNIFHFVTEFNNEKSLEEIFTILKNLLTNEELKSLLIDKNVNNGVNCLHLATQFNNQAVVEKFCNILESFLEVDEFKKLFKTCCFNGRNIFHFAAINKENEGVFTKLLNYACQRKILNDEDVKTLLQQKDSDQCNIFHLVANLNNEKSLKEIFTTLKNLLTNEELKSLLIDKNVNGVNCLHSATLSNNQAVVEEMCIILESFLEADEFKNLFKTCGFKGQNIFHIAAINKKNEGVFTKVLNYASQRKILNDEEVKTLLQQKYFDQWNIFQLVANLNNEKSLKEIFTILKNLLTNEELKSLLIDKNFNGVNCLHSATLSNNQAVVEEMCIILESFLEADEFKKLFKTCCLKGQNIFHIAAMNKENEGVFTKVLNCASQRKILNDDEVKTLLQQKDSDQWNIFQLVANLNNEKSLKEIFTILKNLLTNEELKSLLIDKNVNGDNCLHSATLSSNQAVVEELCNILEIFLEADEFKKLLKTCGFRGRNIFHFVAINKENEGVFTKILNCVNQRKILNDDEVKTLLQQKDSDQCNIFHLVANLNNEKSLKEIFTTLKNLLTNEELKSLLIEKNVIGNNCLHSATQFNNQAVVEEFCNILESFLEADAVKELFKTCGSNGQNIFHNTAMNKGNEGVFTKLLNCASQRKILNDEEVKTLLQQKDSDQCNIFQLVANLNNEKSLKEIFTTLKNLLTNEELKSLLIDKNVNGVNCLHLATQFNNQAVVEELCSILESFLEADEFKDLFKTCGFKGQNIFHLALMNKGNEGVFTKVLNYASQKKILNDEEVKTLLQQKYFDQWNIFQLVANVNNEKSLKEIFTTLENLLTDEELKSLLIDKNVNGVNCLHLATQFNNQAVVEEFCNILESFLEADEFKDLFKTCGFKGQNIFHFAAINKGNEGVFTKLLNYASQRKILYDGEVKTLLQQKDSDQCNIFQFVANLSNEKSLKEIFTTLKDLLTNEELKTLLIDKNVNGVNCLHSGTLSNNQAFVEELCNILESFLEADEVKELFKTCGFRGRNIFHFVAINKENEGVFTKLLNYASQRKILNDGEVKTLLQQKDSDQCNIFQLVANVNNEKSLKEIFTTLKNLLTNEELKSLLIDKNVNGDNCLHLATQFNNQAVVEEFCNILESFLEADELKKLLKTFGFKGRNIFHFAAMNKDNEGVFTKLLNYASQRKILNDEEVKTLLQQKDSDQWNIFQLVANVNNEKSLKEIFTTLKDLLTNEELKSLLIDKNVNGVNCLHLATQFNNQAVVEEFCNILQSFLEADEFKKLLKTFGFKGRNIFHFAAMNKENEGVFTKLLNYASQRKIFNDEEVKTLLQQKDSDQWNIFQFVANLNNEKSLKEIFITLKNLLTNEELKSLLIDKNVNGVNCLHLATQFNNQAVVEEFCNILESFLEADEFKDLFKTCGFRGRNIFHFAAINKENEGVFTKLLNYASQRKILNDEEVKTLLQQKDSDQYNIFQLVANVNNEKSLKEIFTTLKDLLTNEELKTLLIDKNVNGVNCLHLATQFNNQAVIEEFCNILESFLEADEFKDLFKTCGFRGRNIFHFAAINKENEGVFTKLLNYASQRKILNDEEVKTLLQQKDSDQYNIFQLVANVNNEKSLKEIFTTLKDLLTNEELKTLLIDKNVNGVNCLHLATQFKNQAVVEEFCNILESFLEADEFKDLFKTCNFKGQNIFHFAAINKENEGVFTKVLNCASQRKILNDEEVKTLFQQKDSNQYNIFHFVANLNNEKSLKEIFTTLKDLLTNEELKSLLIDKNVNGDNCLHLATRFNNQAVVEELCNILVSFLEADAVKELFKTCGFRGRNIFHFAAINKENEGIFTKVLNCASQRKILNDEEVKTLLLQKYFDQWNIFQLVANLNNEKSLKEIFTTLKDLLTNEELKSLLIDKNVNGDNCLHLATRFNNQAAVEELCNILESFLEADAVKELFKTCGSNGQNIFHNTAMNKGNEGVFTKLLNCASQRKILNDEEVKTLLQQKDSDKYNIFQLVANVNNEKSLKEIFTTLKDLLTNEELKTLLIDKNVNGVNCLHLATQFKNQAVVEEFCNILESFLEADEFKDLFKTCNFKGQNIFHFAAINKENEGVFTKVLNCASQRKILNDEEVKTLLQQKDSNQCNIFHFVANLNNEKSLKEIFTTLKDLLTNEELKSLLIDKNVNGDNCLHLATRFNNQAVVEELCNILVSFLEADAVKELFKTCGFRGRNIFHFAAINKENEGIFTKVLNCASQRKILNDEEVKTLLQQKYFDQWNIFQLVANLNNEKSLKEIFTTLKDLLTNEELKSLLIDKNVNGDNCLHLATQFNNQAVVEELCNILESFLETDEVKELFKTCGFRGRNIFHNTAMNKGNEGVFTKVLNCASQRKILNDEEVKTLLQQKDSNQCNIFQFVANVNNEKSLKEIFTILINLLTNEELKTLLIDKNVDGNNCLHLATQFNNQAVVEELCNILESFLETDEVKELFKTCGFKGQNIFHFVAINKENEGVFTKLLNYASQRKILNDDEVKTLFQQKDFYQGNIFHFVTEFNNEKSLKEIFTTLKNLLTNEELKTLLIDKNVNGDNCLHLATQFNNQAVVEELCNILESFLETDEVKELFKTCGFKGQNIFHLAAINKENEGVFTKVLNYASQRKILNDDEVKTLLQQKDFYQGNIFHFVTEFNNEKSLKEIFTTLKDLFTNEELKSLLIDKNVNGVNCLHLAIANNNQAVVEELCNILESFLETDEVKELFKTCGFRGRNIFHFAAINKKNEGVFTKLMNYASQRKILYDGEVKTLLQQKDSDQWNIFQFVTVSNNEKSLKEIFITLKNFLTNEELKSLLIDKNVNGDNCLHLAIANNNQAVVEELCNILESFLEVDEVKELFKTCGFRGRNIFHFAAINKENEGVFTKVLNCASQRKILNDEEVKTLLQQKDSDQCNIFQFVTVSNYEKSLKEIFTTLKDLLTDEELKSLLIDKNVNGNNCLHSGTLSNNQAFVEEFCNILQSFLEVDEVKELFKTCGFRGRNIFHFAAINKKNEGVFTKLLNYASQRKILYDGEVKTLLQQKDSDQWNIFQLVANLNNEKSLKEIFITLKNLLTNEELKSLLIDKNVNGDNCLHLAIANNNQAVVEELCNILESFLEADAVKELFKTCGFRVRNIFHFAAMNKENEGVFTKLLNCVSKSKILNDEEVKTLLLQKDFDQYNIFHFVTRCNNEKSLKEIFTTLKNLLKNEELKSLLIDKNVNGDNCLHLAIANNNQAVVEELCNILESFLEADAVKELFKTCGFRGRNIFHFAAMNKENEGVFTKLLNCVSKSKILNDEEVKTLLLQKDFDQYNIFHFVTRCNNEKSLKEIFTTLKNLLKNEELKTLLIDKNVNGDNCLHLAIQFNNQAVVEELCSILESFLEPDEVKKLFKTSDFNGLNIFHKTAMNKSNEGVFRKLLNCVSKSKNLNDDEVKTLLQQKDSNQCNIFHYVTEFNNEKSLKEIFTTLKDLLTNEELKSLLIDKDNDRDNCLHLAIKFNNQAVVEELCNIFESFLEADAVKELFKICGFNGEIFVITDFA